MKKYDFVFGLGRACACSQTLRAAGLQLLSLPWDWVTRFPKTNVPDVLERVKIIESGFEDWLREEDLEFVSHVAANGKDQYRNKRLDIIYPHDFPRDVPLHESFPAVKAKYDRRVKRFKKLLATAKNRVLAMYMDTPVSPKASAEACREAQRRLQNLYPRVKVDFLMLSLEPGVDFENRKVEDLGDGLMRVAFDFKDHQQGKPEHSVRLDKCAAALKSLASVRDYRTREEIKAERRRTRIAKMREYGVNSEWEYFLKRRRMELARLREAVFPRCLVAKMRRKAYDHVLSLGMNCEPAFRFSLSWGFVDSTPFSWGLFSGTRQLADAIRNPDLIGADGFSFREDVLMWECKRTESFFHGRLDRIGGIAPDQKAIEEDKADLVQRLKYLNDKFSRVLSDESSKAIIFRLHTGEALAKDANERVDAVQRALEARGARNYTLVVVTERSARGRISAAGNRVVRSVRAFNPGGCVTKAKLGDPVGWNALFAEFTPAKILPKKHPFKFERQ